MNRLALALALAIALSLPATASAWEPQTTHAGLTERAALSSELHTRLREHLGLERGLLAPLTIPPDDAAALFEWLRRLDPLHGYVPDQRGRMSALGWLTAGAVVADVPARNAAHHFFDPTTGAGLDGRALSGLSTRLRHWIGSRRGGDELIRNGMPAVDWVTHPDNPMSLAGFLDQYAKAVRASSSIERERHLAGALLAAGALLHVLQDMAVPSRVRNDLAAHAEQVGTDSGDIGARFERLAALAYGRLGVPGPTRAVSATDLRGFFTSADNTGLADRTAHGYFSPGTLPREAEARRDMSREALASLLARVVRRPHPAPLPQLDLRGASAERDGVPLVDASGVCLAQYRLSRGMLRWSMDDDCMMDQIAALLPEASAYSEGLLDWLFRGTIALERTGAELVISPDIALGKGTLELFWDDAGGARSPLGQPVALEVAAAKTPTARVAQVPAGARRVTALFTGVDQLGQPVVATGTLSL